MLRAESGTIWPSHRSNEKLSTPGWELHEGKGPRSFTQKITFAEPFDDPPKVFLALSGFDLIEEENISITLRATEITRKSMNIVFSTTHSSSVWSAAASYIAYGSRESEREAAPTDNCSARIESGNYAFINQAVLSSGKGERMTSVNVLFPHPFKPSAMPPNVVACISGVSARNGQKVKVNVRVSDVTNTSFRLTAITWGKTSLHSVYVSWIAYESSLSQRSPNSALMISGLSKFEETEPGYTLVSKDDEDDDDDDNDDDADFVHHIMFPKKFSEKPSAVVCLTGFSIGKDEDYRIKTIERELNPSGFNLVLGTWCGTQVYGASAAWIAFRQGKVLPLPPSTFSSLGASFGPPPCKVVKTNHYSDDDDDDVSTEEEEEEEEEEKEEEEEEKKKVKSQSSGLNCVDVRDLPDTSKPTDATTSTTDDDGGDASFGSSDVGSECKICFANKINTVIIPCGHLCVCDSCAKYLTGPKPTCPICRSTISKIIRAYLT